MSLLKMLRGLLLTSKILKDEQISRWKRYKLIKILKKSTATKEDFESSVNLIHKNTEKESQKEIDVAISEALEVVKQG